MGFLDDVTGMVNRGVGAADQKTQIIRLENELASLETKKTSLLAEFGRAVLMQQGSDPQFAARYAAQIQPISDLERRQAEINASINELRNREAVVTTQVTGNPTSYAVPSAGAAAIKRCPKCGATYAENLKFCMSCGSALVDIAPAPAPAPAPSGNAASVCPRCGAPVTPGTKFCKQCGNKLI